MRVRRLLHASTEHACHALLPEQGHGFKAWCEGTSPRGAIG